MKTILTALLLLMPAAVDACSTGQCRACQIQRIQQVRVIQQQPQVQQFNFVGRPVMNAYQPQSQLVELQYRVAQQQMQGMNYPRMNDAECAELLEQFLLFRELMQRSSAGGRAETPPSVSPAASGLNEPTLTTALGQSCAKCHSATVDKSDTGLDLTKQYSELSAGVKLKSLVRVLVGEMPPKKPLGDQQVADIISELHQSLSEGETNHEDDSSSGSIADPANSTE